MTQKKCKALRKRVAVGFDKVPLIMKYTTMTYQKLGQPDISYEIPLTFKYPEDSFQRVYRDIKRGKSIPSGESEL